jgi:hypothetical protein
MTDTASAADTTVGVNPRRLTPELFEANRIPVTDAPRAAAWILVRAQRT